MKGMFVKSFWLLVVPAFLAPGLAYAQESGSSQGSSPELSKETIVFLRHGEKPKEGLGQLNCKGLNRAMALPKVLDAKFGKPAAIFAPNPSKRKEDGAQTYDYVRPLATIEPTAIRLGLPVDTTFGYEDIDDLRKALEKPDYHGATLFVAWEHRLAEHLAKKLMAEHGGEKDTVPKWESPDFDSLYVVTITWSSKGKASAVAFDKQRQGLDGQPDACSM